MHFWGGPSSLLQLHKICQTFNLGFSLHSDRELGVSTAAIVHFGAAQQIVHAIDSHMPEQAGDLITKPFVFENGCLRLPDGPGLGVELDPEQVDRYHRAFLEVGERDEFQDELRPGWRPQIPQW
jgi:glucarate dehydratase